MKFKSFLVAILATFVLGISTSSHALDIYLRNSTVHNIIFFKFPNGITYGPIAAYQQAQLPLDISKSLANQVGEVFYASNTGIRSCGVVDFSKATAITFYVNIIKQCKAYSI